MYSDSMMWTEQEKSETWMYCFKCKWMYDWLGIINTGQLHLMDSVVHCILILELYQQNTKQNCYSGT